ncbi:MAG: type II secretion system protein GspG [Acidobacteriota bacterium]
MLRVAGIALVSVMLVSASSCNKDEQAAQRLFDKAQKYEKAKQYEQALAVYDELKQKYPMTKVAKSVDRAVDFKFIQGAISIDRLKNVNEVKENLKVIAKAIESYYFKAGSYPPNLDVLVPAYMETMPRDPWGARYSYGVTNEKNEVLDPPGTAAKGYMLAWFGRDRIPGGTNDDSDVFIVNGELKQP